MGAGQHRTQARECRRSSGVPGSLLAVGGPLGRGPPWACAFRDNSAPPVGALASAGQGPHGQLQVPVPVPPGSEVPGHTGRADASPELCTTVPGTQVGPFVHGGVSACREALLSIGPICPLATSSASGHLQTRYSDEGPGLLADLVSVVNRADRFHPG